MKAFLWSIALGACCLVGACDGELTDASTDSGREDVFSNDCTPTTCEAQGKNCGVMPDGCGGTLECGGCTAPDYCSANVCGPNMCTPTTCEVAMRCGVISDGCAGTLNCGDCFDAGPDASEVDASPPDATVDAVVGQSDAMLDAAVPDARQGDV